MKSSGQSGRCRTDAGRSLKKRCEESDFTDPFTSSTCSSPGPAGNLSTETSSVHGLLHSLYAEQEQRRQRTSSTLHSFYLAADHTASALSLTHTPNGRDPGMQQFSEATTPELPDDQRATTLDVSQISALYGSLNHSRRQLDFSDPLESRLAQAEEPIKVKVECQCGSRRSTFSRHRVSHDVPGQEEFSTKKRPQRQAGLQARVETTADCTFHPTVSSYKTGSKNRSTSSNTDVQNSTHSFVYDRLYPANGLTKSPDCTGALTAEEKVEEKELEKDEHVPLRQHCGGLHWNSTRSDDAFQLSLANAIGTDWHHNSISEHDAHESCAVRTACTSEVLHRPTTKGVSSSPSGSFSTVREERRQPPKISSPRGGSVVGTKDLQDFFERQKAFAATRECNLRTVEMETTPSFKPTTTARSARLAAQILERSIKRQGDDASREELAKAVEQHHALHLPLSYGVLPRARSKTSLRSRNASSSHMDPSCSFRPAITPAAQRLARHGIDRCHALYRDHSSRDRARSEAREAAAKVALSGLTFEPKLNANRRSTSVLNASHYHKLEAMRQKKEQAQRLQREAMQHEREQRELAECTFHPRTNKMPSYLSQMASTYAEMERRATTLPQKHQQS